MCDFQTLRLIFEPGRLEALDRHSDEIGAIQLNSLTKMIKSSRDTLYVSIALTHIGTFVSLISDEDSPKQLIGAVIITFGLGLTSYAAKKFFDATALFAKMKNR